MEKRTYYNYFSYLCKAFATLAQLVEQRIRNAWVVGSSPAGGSKVIVEGVLFSRGLLSVFHIVQDKVTELFHIAEYFCILFI